MGDPERPRDLARTAKIAAACLVVVCVAGALAVLSRRSASVEIPIATYPTDDRLVVGVIADTRSAEGSKANEYLRGIRLWQYRLDELGGIPYGIAGFMQPRVAAVDVRIRDDRGSPREAARAAERLVATGATVLFGPPAADELEAVSIVAARGRVALLSPIKRPASVPRRRLFTFFGPPAVGDFHGVLDAYAALLKKTTPRRPRSSVRIAVIAQAGDWAMRGREAVNLAKLRAYRSELFRVDETSAATQFAAAQAFRPDVLLVSAPYEIGRTWAARYRGQSRAIWALAAPEVRLVEAAPPPPSVVVTVPWSPTPPSGGLIFPPGRFIEMYRDAYGGTPSSDAAAAAALGELLTVLVITARSTDTLRILGARTGLNAGSHFGPLNFNRGEQSPSSPVVVRWTGEAATPIWPVPAVPDLLVPADGG